MNYPTSWQTTISQGMFFLYTVIILFAKHNLGFTSICSDTSVLFIMFYQYYTKFIEQMKAFLFLHLWVNLDIFVGLKQFISVARPGTLIQQLFASFDSFHFYGSVCIFP